MMQGSNLTAEISYSGLPIIPEVRDYIAQKAIPGATARNWNATQAGIELAPEIDEKEASVLLPDPQTNGGLLIAVAPDAVKEVQTILENLGIQYRDPIGICKKPSEKRIIIQK
jgi:selenide,water dikinase